MPLCWIHKYNILKIQIKIHIFITFGFCFGVFDHITWASSLHQLKISQIKFVMSPKKLDSVVKESCWEYAGTVQDIKLRSTVLGSFLILKVILKLKAETDILITDNTKIPPVYCMSVVLRQTTNTPW